MLLLPLSLSKAVPLLELQKLQVFCWTYTFGTIRCKVCWESCLFCIMRAFQNFLVHWTISPGVLMGWCLMWAVDEEDVFQPTSNCAIHFALQKQSSDGDDHTSNQPSKNTLKSGNMHHSSKSGEQAQLVPSGVCQSNMFHVSLFQRRALISLIR